MLEDEKLSDDNNQFTQNITAIIDRYRDPSGNVNYFAIMGDSATVKYAESLADFDLSTLESREERLAFWINCYNSLSIYGVIKKLKKDPEFINRGFSSWFERVRYFALQKFVVGGKEYTLRGIENHIREEFQDPRIHFALNCSTMGCPLLKDGLYSAENIDDELDAAAELYLRSPRGAKLDKEKTTLYVSRIFKWYKKDFTRTGLTRLQYVAQYVSEDKRKFLEENSDSINIKYLDYDWKLNISESMEDSPSV